VLNAACKSTRTAEEWEALEKENKLMAYSDLETDVDPFICFKKNPNEHIESDAKSSQKCDSRESELYSASKLAELSKRNLITLSQPATKAKSRHGKRCSHHQNHKKERPFSPETKKRQSMPPKKCSPRDFDGRGVDGAQIITEYDQKQNSSIEIYRVKVS